MEPINTAKEFLARIAPYPATARLVDFRFTPGWECPSMKTPGETIRQSAVFVACWLASSKEDALAAAQATLQTIAGHRAYIRVPPEADTHVDFETEEMLYKGYVRAHFFNEPGEWEYPEKEAGGFAAFRA